MRISWQCPQFVFACNANVVFTNAHVLHMDKIRMTKGVECIEEVPQH